MPDAVVADVVAAAEATGADIEAVVEVLRSRMKLGVIGVSHALGIDASLYIQGGTKRLPAVVAAADQLWAAVIPTGAEFTPPAVGKAWMRGAACRGKDPAIWYCESDGEVCADEIEAVSICERCPAVGYCALASLSEQEGIWAGMTHRNRTRLRRMLRLGVVPATPDDVAPLALDIARSSLEARINSQRPQPTYPDGRLFLVEPAAAATPRHRNGRRPRPSATASLFA